MSKHAKFAIAASHSLIIVLWASAFVGIRVGLTAYTPGQLSLLRFLTGSALLLILAAVFRIRLPERKDVPMILLLGFLGFFVYHAALNYGEQTVSAGAASLFVSTTPIFASLFALVFFRERFGIRGWIGAVVGFGGVAISAWGTGEPIVANGGVMLILIASLAESVYFTFQKPFIEKYGFLAFTAYTIWAGTLFMLFFLPGLGQAVESASFEVTASVLYLGIFPTVLPYLALAFITARVGTSEATSSLYLTPAFAYVIGWVWLGEVPSFLSLIGGAIALGGVLLATVHSDARPDTANRMDTAT
ncbi:UNVERIFIED_CONTAM: drug/metabolite transporter (DMT)-like permease [Brevibacillus sp. OAP136]